MRPLRLLTRRNNVKIVLVDNYSDFEMEYIALHLVNGDTYMQDGYRPPGEEACQ
jgi:hypothetical protein